MRARGPGKSRMAQWMRTWRQLTGQPEPPVPHPNEIQGMGATCIVLDDIDPGTLQKDEKMKWSVYQSLPGRYTVTGGVLSFEIHQLIDGSHGKTIVSVHGARQYAEYIVRALNAYEVHRGH